MGNEGSRPSPLRRSNSRHKSSNHTNTQAITSGHQYVAEDEVDSRINNDIILQTPKPLKRMDKIRRSLSFRKKKKSSEDIRKKLQSNTSHDIQTNNGDASSSNMPTSMSVPGNITKDFSSAAMASTSSERPSGAAVKPSNWIEDEKKVRAGSCSFQVKYLGSVEVSDSRGMHLCESAIEKLLAEKERKKPIKAILYVSGDSLRVVDESNKTLLVDQTIEKVSFCAPDRHHENGFAYICRDGTTRRWLCYCFMAIKDTLKGTSATGGSASSGGERLSHAVGCAFSVCLEKKQKREKENVSMEVGPNHSFSRFGSFRQASLTERLEDPQMVMPGANNVPIKPVANPYAIERPKANPDAFTRQNSLRGTGALQLPFKRGSNAYTSLKPGELPSFQLQKANSGLNVNTNTMTSGNVVTKTSLLMQQHQINTTNSNSSNNNNNNNVATTNLSSKSQNSFSITEQNKIGTICELPEESNINNNNNSINLTTPNNQVPDKWASIFPTPQSIPVSPRQQQTEQLSSMSPVTPPPLPPMPAIQTSANINQYQKQQMFHQQNHAVNQSMPARVNTTPLQQQFSLMSMTPNNMATGATPNPNETFEQKWARIQAAKKTNPFAEDIAKKYEIKLT